MLLPSGNPFKCHEEVLYFQLLLVPPKRFDIFSPRLGDAQKVQVHSDFYLSIVPVQLTTSRIEDHARLMSSLLNVMTIHRAKKEIEK